MADREDNIFYNLVKNETSLTEVFCNLMKYKAFREMFLKLVKEKNKVNFEVLDVKFDDFDTEVALNIDDEEDLGRADLVLTTDEAEYIFELKIELYTGLTDHQPGNYLKYLRSKNESVFNENLFFIVPKGYMHLSTIHTKWNQEDDKYSKDTILSNNMLYWQDILAEIRKQELDKLNPFISEFCDILDYRWLKYEKITFTKQELELIFSNKKDKGYKMLEERSMPATISKLFEIVNNVAYKIDYIGKDNKQQSEYYGYFVNNKKYNISDDFQIFFGVNFEVWEKEGCPIMIEVYSINEEEDSVNKKIEELFPEFTKYCNEDGEIVLFYLGLKKEELAADDTNITATLHAKIADVVSRLPHSR